MLLVLSISFHCHYYIWGCMCSTSFSLGDWKDISGAHVIIIIKSEISTLPIIIIFRGCVPEMFLHHILLFIAYTFRENREFVFIIIVQFVMSANSRIRFGLQIVFVCLYTTPSHYHHCANVSKNIEFIKCLSDIFCRVCKIKHSFSVIHYTIKWGCVFPVYPFPLWWLRVNTLVLLSSNRQYELLSIV